MKVKVSKWGNSLGIRLPQEIIKGKINEGNILDIEMIDDVLTAKKIKKELSLEELLEGITPENYGGEIDFGEAVGKEIW